MIIIIKKLQIYLGYKVVLYAHCLLFLIFELLYHVDINLNFNFLLLIQSFIFTVYWNFLVTSIFIFYFLVPQTQAQIFSIVFHFYLKVHFPIIYF